MKPKTEKIILTSLIGASIIGGFEALISILNLYQIGIFIVTADFIYLFLVFNIIFVYDLHFKKISQKSSLSNRPFIRRTEHFWSLDYIGQYFNYLLLPTLIFWATVIILYLNFGSLKVQQTIALISSAALIVAYWYIKEIFSRHREKVDEEIFIRMTIIKIYAAVVSFAAAMSLMRSYCLSPYYFAVIIFAVTFALVFQALFQHKMNTIKNIFFTAIIAVTESVAAFYVYQYWGLNFYTGAIALGILYNMLWGTFHYHLDQALTKRAFLEILVVSVLLAAMVFGATNFKAQVLDACI